MGKHKCGQPALPRAWKCEICHDQSAMGRSKRCIECRAFMMEIAGNRLNNYLSDQDYTSVFCKMCKKIKTPNTSGICHACMNKDFILVTQ